MAKKHHFFTSLRKTEQNIFVPFGLATGVFEELPLMADGSFAVWDSERNRKSREKEAPPPAFVMTFKEVFNGLAGEGDARLCNGLIVDWAAWSDSRTYGFLAEQLSDGNQVSLVHREDIRTK